MAAWPETERSCLCAEQGLGEQSSLAAPSHLLAVRVLFALPATACPAPSHPGRPRLRQRPLPDRPVQGLTLSHSSSRRPASLLPSPLSPSARISFLSLFTQAPTLESKRHKNRNFCLTIPVPAEPRLAPGTQWALKYLLTEEVGRNVAIKNSQSKYMVSHRRW